MANDEIIEKRASSPIATSCLVVAAAALAGAIGIQLVEVGLLRIDGDIRNQARQETARLASAVEAVISENTAGDERRPGFEEDDPDGADDSAAGDEPETEKAGDEEAGDEEAGEEEEEN